MKEDMNDSVGIYIHIPFCIKKCRYCDFLSFPMSAEAHERYVNALLLELGQRRGMLEGRTVSSVFIGGGTPSAIAPELIARIMDRLRGIIVVDEGAEITIEANPGTLDGRKLEAYLGAGINRLSLGVQSSHVRELEALGRIHSFDEFEANYMLARRTGFRNINADLMFGIPGQTPESYRQTLEAICGVSPEHISAYSLIIEEGTPFYEIYGGEGDAGTLCGTDSGGRGSLESGAGRGLQLPDEDSEREMYRMTVEYLRVRGYRQYEISNYAKPGYESRHNTLYWRRGEYIGFGQGAATFAGGVRYKNPSGHAEYIEAAGRSSPVYEEETALSRRDSMAEFMFLGLRMTEGVEKGRFEECFGVGLRDVYGAVIDRYVQLGLLCEDGPRVCLTQAGVSVSNTVFADFLL